MNQQAYIIKHNNPQIRKESRSGGVFTALSDIILDNNGIVYGCAVNDEYLAEHRRAETKAERDTFRGSKYVQSNMKNSMQQVKEDLLNGRTVMFSGTGCQIAALKKFLEVSNINMDNLYTIDIVCHGVPSPYIWKDFLKYMEKKYNGKVENVNFRDKRYGWAAHFETVKINGKIKAADYYRIMFYDHYSLRPSCYQCPYCNLERNGDITIADAWGVHIHNSDFDDDKGCSLALVNTEKGQKLLQSCMNDIICKSVNMKDFMQPNLKRPSSRPSNREDFWNDYLNNDFEYISVKYAQNTTKGHISSLLKRIFRRTGITQFINKLR